MEHHSKPHGDIRALSVSAHNVLADRKRQLEAEAEAVRQNYEQQLKDKAADDWLRNLATSGLAYREITGSTSKTERFLSRLAEVMARDNETGKTTAEIVEELARITGIELEVEK